MAFYINNIFYRVFIDPVLSPLHRSVLVHLRPSDDILDVACGTGALATIMARKARHITGIDLSDEYIAAAQCRIGRKGIKNVIFEVRDAGNLSDYENKQFDLAVTSMAVHQFDSSLAVKILAEMKRIAARVIIADYNHHMPRRWGRSVAWSIEYLAGGDHYRNFRTYMRLGGIHYFARQSGIYILSEEIRGGGVFLVALGESIGNL
jgi:SAM-dependent methyltransferase